MVNTSTGIEPFYFWSFHRTGRMGTHEERVTVYDEWLTQHPDEPLPDYFVTTDDITPQQHLAVQAAAQKWIDSSISKTINVPTDCPYDEFKDIYLDAYHQGLKGCTTFRFNPEVFQGVLVREEDIAATTYRFTLADGSVIEAQGNEEILYDGETHTAANLYDALKEGYYGKL